LHLHTEILLVLLSKSLNFKARFKLNLKFEIGEMNWKKKEKQKDLTWTEIAARGALTPAQFPICSSSSPAPPLLASH
jgi:hypothetical protein